MNTSTLTQEKLFAYRDELTRDLNHLIDILNRINQDMMNIDTDDAKNQDRLLTPSKIDEFIKIIEGEQNKLQDFSVVLSVIGTMKAGKSTTLNAIIGRQVLPNRNLPMTALPTLIRHTVGCHEPILYFQPEAANQFAATLSKHDMPENILSENEELINTIKNKAIHFNHEYRGEEEIYRFLIQLNDLVRLAGSLAEQTDDEKFIFPYTKYQDFTSLPTIDIEFASLINTETENQNKSTARLCLLDTPGPNESGQKHLRPMLEQQLKRCSAALVVLDYTQLNSEANNEIITQIEALPTVEKDRLFALVNKFDQKKAGSLNAEQIPQYVLDNYLDGKIEKHHIFPISAERAYYANRMEAEIRRIGKKPEWQEDSWIQDFAEKAFGEDAEEMWPDATLERIQKSIASQRKKSLLEAPINQAINKTQENGAFIAIRSALAKLKHATDSIGQYIESHKVAAERHANDLMVQFNEALEQLNTHRNTLTEIESKVKQDFEDAFHATQEKIGSDITASKNDIEKDIENTIKGLKDDITGKKDASEKNYKTQYGGFKYWLTLASEAELNQGENNEQVWESIKQKFGKNDEYLIFTSQSEFDEMIKEMTNVIHLTAEDFLKKIEKSFEEQWTKLNKNIIKHQSTIDAIIANMQDNLDSENINITLPSFSNISNQLFDGHTHSLTFGAATKKTDTILIDNKSWFSSITRTIGGWLGKTNWGKTEQKKEYFEYPKQDLIDTLYQYIENIANDTESEISVDLSSYQANVLGQCEYIIETGQEIVGELKHAADVAQDNSQDAELHRNTAVKLANKHNQIKENFQHYVEVFSQQNH